MKKKTLGTLLAVFFVLMIIATIAAENIYYNSLPVITAGKPMAGNLTANYWMTGKLEYEKVQNSLCSEFGFEKITLLAADGRIAAGAPLYQVDADEVLLLQKQLELAVLDLKDQNDAISPDGKTGKLTERERLQYERNELQIAAKEKQIATLKELYRNEGIVYTEKEGTVAYAIRSGVPVQKGQTIATLTANTEKCWVTWQMIAERAKLFPVGSSVEIRLNVWEEDEKNEETLVSESYLYTLTVAESIYSEQNKNYTLSVEVPESVELAMKDGDNVEVTCRYVSEEEYTAIFPVSAIEKEYDANGETNRGYIYAIAARDRVYGEEYYVIPFYVEIAEQVDNYIALTATAQNYDFVFQSTAPLSEGQAVRLY